MSLELAIKKNTDAIHALIEALTASKPAAPVVAPIETKVVTPAVVEPCAGHAVETAKVEEVSVDQVRQAFVLFAQEKGRDAVITLLDMYGAQTLHDVDAKDLPRLYSVIKAAV